MGAKSLCIPFNQPELPKGTKVRKRRLPAMCCVGQTPAEPLTAPAHSPPSTVHSPAVLFGGQGLDHVWPVLLDLAPCIGGPNFSAVPCRAVLRMFPLMNLLHGFP